MRQPVVIKLDGIIAGSLQPSEADQTLELFDVDPNSMMTFVQEGKDPVRYLVPTPFGEEELVYLFRVGKQQVEVTPTWGLDERLRLRVALKQTLWSRLRNAMFVGRGGLRWGPILVASALLVGIVITTTRKPDHEVSIPGGATAECPSGAECFPFSGNEFRIRLSPGQAKTVCLLAVEPSLFIDEPLTLRIESETAGAVASSALDRNGCASFPAVAVDQAVRGYLRVMAGERVLKSYEIQLSRE